MSSPKPFRFAAQLGSSPDGTAKGWAEQARRAEDLGYATLLMPDHFDSQLAPIPALAAVAAATTTLRLGSLVFGNDYRHPLVLAKEMATLDVLSDGRFEASLGAGWMRTDYEQAGITYDSPGVRVDRFSEAVAVIKGLLSTDGAFSFSGDHYQVSDYTLAPRPVQQPRPPIIIGGGGRRVLTIAGQEADIVSINVDLRAGVAGPEAAPNAAPAMTKQKIEWVKEAAGDRFEEIELNTLIGFVMITDDRDSVIEAMAPVFGLEIADAHHVPLALIGTLAQMEEELHWRREEYGITYFSIEADCWEELGSLVSTLAGT